MAKKDNFSSRYGKNKKSEFRISKKDLEEHKTEFIKRGGKIKKLDPQEIDPHYMVNSNIKNLDAAGYGL